MGNSGPRCKHEYCWICFVDYTRIRREGNAAHLTTCKYHTDNLPSTPAFPETAPRPARARPQRHTAECLYTMGVQGAGCTCGDQPPEPNPLPIDGTPILQWTTRLDIPPPDQPVPRGHTATCRILRPGGVGCFCGDRSPATIEAPSAAQRPTRLVENSEEENTAEAEAQRARERRTLPNMIYERLDHQARHRRNRLLTIRESSLL